MTVADTRPRVLVLARAYPSNVLPTLGIWTRRLVMASLEFADPVVIAPVPWSPPGVPERYARYRRIPGVHNDAGVLVRHPRVPAGPGNLLLSFDGSLQYPVVSRLARRLHRDRPFDLIHAHIIYPDGVVAARIGSDLQIPVITTEHSIWGPALARLPAVRRQVVRALKHITMVTTVSEAARDSFVGAVGNVVPVEVLPNVLDEETFRAPRADETWNADQLLFVGLIRHVKGLDVLIRALPALLRHRPAARLKVIGGTFYRGQERDWDEVRQLVADLGLEARVEFAGQADPAGVAAAMRGSAVVVVPSRREAFSAVAVEAMASGTPVVATRSGGPEEIITGDVGLLVPAEDPAALAAGIAEVLERRATFDRDRLRACAVSRYGRRAVAARMETLYREVLR